MARLTKSKTYKIELFDRSHKWNDKQTTTKRVERYLITWKNDRAETSLVVSRDMPNHIYFLEELLIDEGYEQTFRSPLLK
jgi:hypothetical protein|tara:strand:+ start:358 stop:597 length:240 start_codon:yes stop_codon:yes gene_type:complete